MKQADLIRDVEITDRYFFEKEALRLGFRLPAGVDEAGRGPLAGPVVASAVILGEGVVIEGLNDSKLLTARRREELLEEIMGRARSVGVGMVDAGEIDRINILNASLKAMAEAVRALGEKPDIVFVDGTFKMPLNMEQRTIVGGDRKCASVSAASIVAKVTRDGIMRKYHMEYPRYNFAKNKGYGTVEHREALAKFGPAPVHRRSFRWKAPGKGGERAG